MKVRALILENFRSYRVRTSIPISDLTAFLGKNDAGKSTILEALDIFFDGSTSLDRDDASKPVDGRDVRIGVVFDNLPVELDLDRGARTSLKQECLLNSSGLLEVHKSYNVNAARISAKAFAIANFPTDEAVKDLMQMKAADLKALVKARGLEANCDLNKNPSMRFAILQSLGANPELNEREIALSDGEGKDIWKALEKYLPQYALFRSDRKSTDQDEEAQNPMKAAVAKAIAELAPKLEQITADVRKIVEETASRTIEQMKQSYPDLELASVLEPRFQEPKWLSIFKIDLAAGDGIPLNKRGSGVRRLILMSFFQAEAERLRVSKTEELGMRVPTIYAIEEPETSQHPDNQLRIIEALKIISESGDQVLLTTHTPSLAACLPIESVRYIDTLPNSAEPRVRLGTEEVLRSVVDALGVLPDAVPRDGIKVAVLVEGKTDLDALSCFRAVLSQSGALKNFPEEKIFWAFGGGSTVKDWVERRYLDALNVEQVYLIDSDRDGAAAVITRKVSDLTKLCEKNPRAHLVVTRKRTIENYCHPEAIKRLSKGSVILDAACDLDYGRMYVHLGVAIQSAKANGNLQFNPVDHNGQIINGRLTEEGHCKKVITSYIMKNMTADEIMDRCKYVDGASERFEILEWFQLIVEKIH